MGSCGKLSLVLERHRERNRYLARLYSPTHFVTGAASGGLSKRRPFGTGLVNGGTQRVMIARRQFSMLASLGVGTEVW